MSEHFPIQREEELFDAASRLEGATAQRAYLTAACPDDAALRQRVEELLKRRAAADKFFVQTHDSMPLPRPIVAVGERPQKS